MIHDRTHGQLSFVQQMGLPLPYVVGPSRSGGLPKYCANRSTAPM
jgi:hypothetical protein